MFSCYRTPPVAAAASILEALIKFNPLQPGVALPLGFLTFSGGIEKQHQAVRVKSIYAYPRQLMKRRSQKFL